MAQPVQQTTLRAPGFQGLNTELSPINGDPEFALVADNLVVDQIGRLSTRRAFSEYIHIKDQVNPDRERCEILKLGRDVASVSNVQSQYEHRPVMIYRYSDALSYPSDTRSVPVGMDYKLAVKEGLPELSGNINYSVGTVEGNNIVDLGVPAEYKSEAVLLTTQFVNFSAEDLTSGNDRLLMFCKGKPFLRLDNDTDFVVAGGNWTDAGGNKYPIDGDIATSAYGRVWVTGVGGDYNQIHYSALLDETTWYTEDPDKEVDFNDAGIIDVREYWPVDGDSIVNIHAHNGFLVVFGRRSILLYANADSGTPAGILGQADSGIFLQDTISNVGLIRRDAICNIGTDVLFVDDSGLRSLGRVIQEKSTPLQEPSINIRRELQEVIQQEISKPSTESAIKMSYIPSESLAVMLFASLKIAYAFHLSVPSKTGGLKVTRWTNCFWNDSIELKEGQNTTVLLAGKPTKGLMKYEGYVEGSPTGTPEPYTMRYESMALAIGSSPMQVAIPKSLQFLCMGQYVPGQATALWGFDNKIVSNSEFQIEVDGGSEFNVNEFGLTDDGAPGPTDNAGYWLSGGIRYDNYKVNTSGSGELLRVGLEIQVQGGRYALQEININIAVGRLLA